METGFNGPVFFCAVVVIFCSPFRIVCGRKSCKRLCEDAFSCGPNGMKKGGNMKLATTRQRFICALLYSPLFVLTPLSAFGEDVQGRNWAGACTGCHGTEGRSSGAIPSIAGIEKQKFVRLMMAFRDGSQPATVMHQHARGLNDDQIEKLGDYFSSREPVGGNDK